MTTSVGISALRTTAIINVVRRRSLFPVSHTLCLVAIAPIATLPSISPLSQDMLLGPDGMTLLVTPHALSSVRRLNTARLRVRNSKLNTHFEPFDVKSDAGADAFRSLLADRLACQLGNGAGRSSSAVLISRSFLPGQNFLVGFDNVVVPPAFANSWELVWKGDAI